MVKSMNGFIENSSAASEVIGELLMTAVAFIAFGIIAVFILSFQATTTQHVDIDGWVDVKDDTIHLRHSGGNSVDISHIRILLNLNGTREELSHDDVHAILKSSKWGLGDTIVINTSQLWSITISESDYIDETIVHTGKNIVIAKGVLLRETSNVVEMPAFSIPIPAPTLIQMPTGQTFTPTSTYDTSGGDATTEQVGTDGDNLYTTYNIPKQKAYNEEVYQQFNFNPELTDPVTRVILQINHTSTNSGVAKIKVWEQDALAWHDEIVPKRPNWALETMNVSPYINTQNDINNLKIRYLAYANGAKKKSYIEYVAVYVE